jgi:hypothetical protein
MDSPSKEFFVGLDLGQAKDYTAAVILERTWLQKRPAGQCRPEFLAYYIAGYLRRWQLGTPYTRIVEDVSALVGRPPLDCPTLVVDQTGVGSAVVDMFCAGNLKAILRPVIITAGHETTLASDGTHHVPKKELVSVLQVLLQSRQLKVANVPERELLIRELLAFRVKVTTAANETFEAWRERDHDDMVLAVALAAWYAEQNGSAASCFPTAVELRGLDRTEREPRDRSVLDEDYDCDYQSRRGHFGAGYRFDGGDLPSGFRWY